MKLFFSLVSRNCKVFFRDKGVFFPSLLAPLILLFLFIAFLGNVYRDSIRSVLEGFPAADGIVESIAGGWLVSSLIAVCAVTIAFTANTIMVQDKLNGVRDDYIVSPAPEHIIALAYAAATFLTTFLICAAALLCGSVYLAVVGWHLSAADLLLTLGDMVLLDLFGTLLSSVVCHFISSQGGVTAVQAIVSAAYGFLCGAYMPLDSLAEPLRDALMFFPGSYGTGLLHLHLMGGAIDAAGAPAPLSEALKKGFDCTVTFFGETVPPWVSVLVLVGSIVLLAVLYLFLCVRRAKRPK